VAAFAVAVAVEDDDREGEEDVAGKRRISLPSRVRKLALAAASHAAFAAGEAFNLARRCVGVKELLLLLLDFVDDSLRLDGDDDNGAMAGRLSETSSNN